MAFDPDVSVPDALAPFRFVTRAFTLRAGSAAAVPASGGTEGLPAGVRGPGTAPGAEVVAPPLTFAATANAVLYAGATPVFADIDPRTYNLDPAAVEAAVTERTKAVVAVDIFGYPCELDELRAICDREGILLVVDEVQTGFGRTGRMFAMEHFGVEPDVMTVAKSIAAGLPLSAVVGRAEIMDAPDEGAVGGTFVGNPVAQAAALAVLDVFEEEGLVERARHVGETIRTRMLAWQERFPAIGDVRGMGLMQGVELVKDRKTKETAGDLTNQVLERARASGLIAGKGMELVASMYLFGGIYLLINRLITWHIPTAYLAAIAVTAGVLQWHDPAHNAGPLFHLLAGGTMLGAFFIATDPVTACTTPRGKLIFAGLAGFLTVIIRTFGGYPDGVAFSVLIMNAAAPFIDAYTQPRVFGHAEAGKLSK